MRFRLQSYNRLTKITTSVDVGGVVKGDFVHLFCGAGLVGVTKKEMYETEDANRIWVYPSEQYMEFNVHLSTLADTLASALFIRQTDDYIIMSCRICNNFNVEYLVIEKETGNSSKGSCDREAYRDGYVETQYPAIGSTVTIKGKKWRVESPYDELDIYLCSRGDNTKVIGCKTIVKY